jgi:lysozyme
VRTSPRGVKLITDFEGFRATAYQDVVGVWTVGYGFTKGVKKGDKITRAQADARLREELVEYEQGVWRACRIPPNQNQFDALVCFAFNVGVAGMTKSSVIKAHNRGDYIAAARAFGLWNKAGGKVWPGLTRRRAAEAALYLEQVPDEVSDPVEGPLDDMPQAVDPERPMTASTINRASVVAGGTAAVATVAETARTVADVKYSVASLGDWLVPILLLLLVGLCGYIVWERVRQRKGGWA